VQEINAEEIEDLVVIVSYFLLGMKLDSASYTEATSKIITWVKAGERRSVCAASAHMVMESFDSDYIRLAINSTDMVVSDGMPLVWWLRSHGVKNQQRVYGPDLMLYICQAAANEGIPIGLYGSTDEIIRALIKNLSDRFPKLSIKFAISPPFRPIDSEEDNHIIQQINLSGIKILFVGLGCPKQEIWMADHKGQIKPVMIAVGAAFQFHAGLVKQAPAWVQKIGLEWFFRMIQEPKRLWKRYFYVIPRFSFLLFLEMIGIKRFQKISNR
jgi:N-acetylglucosaminyldiphosphoundecaprenol N-acetyl-beta-D-mannosaminyltransferase